MYIQKFTPPPTPVHNLRKSNGFFQLLNSPGRAKYFKMRKNLKPKKIGQNIPLLHLIIFFSKIQSVKAMSTLIYTYRRRQFSHCLLVATSMNFADPYKFGGISVQHALNFRNARFWQIARFPTFILFSNESTANFLQNASKIVIFSTTASFDQCIIFNEKNRIFTKKLSDQEKVYNLP